MSQLFIPEDIIKDKELFKQWFATMYRQLFKGEVYKESKGQLPTNFEARVLHIEKIMEVVNLFLKGVPQVPTYKIKNKKHNCDMIDVLCVTTHIIKTHYDISLTDLGKILGVGHATIIYYLSKFDSMCIKKGFKYTYVRLLQHLIRVNLLHLFKLNKAEFKDILHIIDNEQYLTKKGV